MIHRGLLYLMGELCIINVRNKTKTGMLMAGTGHSFKNELRSSYHVAYNGKEMTGTVQMRRQSMEKIHLVMPMGGGGTRFGREDFQLPKPLIELQGKPFFFWAAQSIMKFVDVEDIIFIVLQEHINRFKIDEKILEYYPEAVIRVIPHVLNGAVLTCCEGIKAVADELPLLFNDCDHAFVCKSFYDFCKKANFSETDGALLTFASDSPNYSYVEFDSAGRVTGTIEKTVVSSEAICGAYYFKNKTLFHSAVEEYLQQCAYTEFFISGVYNELVRQNKRIITFPTNEHIPFGTPGEYDLAVHDRRLEVFV